MTLARRRTTHVAKNLGIHKEALRRWIRPAETEAGERDDRLTTAEWEELKQIRRKNTELRRANEIPKATSAFFAAELCATRRDVDREVVEDHFRRAVVAA
ncbi:Transposase [Streptomyces malaysiensis subsp. malaysiensis]|uniref:transposase n=1 Tax=Streptomyces malaysiensis TaxID=92644 RepID=UPI000C2BEFBF|nr:transposase [Streptomyces sp. M56]AUA07929.1 Transposase [Streptomyces sp. M56]